MRAYFLLCLMWVATIGHAEVFRWKDANGVTVFGDNPPESVKAAEVELPLLTVADSFFSNKDEKKQEQPTEASNEDSASDETSAETGDAYTRFSVKSPASNTTLRSNSGSVEVQLDIQPPLREGHGVVFYLDGKQVGGSSASSITLTEVSRGQHSVFAVLHDAKKRVLTNTESVNFDLLRATR